MLGRVSVERILFQAVVTAWLNERLLGLEQCVQLGCHCVGVYLCKHADVISPEPLKPRQSGTLVVFKVIKVTCNIMVIAIRSLQFISMR